MAAGNARAELTEVTCGLTETQANELCANRQAAHAVDPNTKSCQALSYNYGDQRPLTTSTSAIGCAWLYSSPHVLMEHRDGWVSGIASEFCPQGTEKDGSSCVSCPEGKWASEQWREGAPCQPFPEHGLDGHFPWVAFSLKCGREGECNNPAGLKSLSRF